jgi:hypothetical protein
MDTRWIRITKTYRYSRGSSVTDEYIGDYPNYHYSKASVDGVRVGLETRHQHRAKSTPYGHRRPVTSIADYRWGAYQLASRSPHCRNAVALPMSSSGIYMPVQHRGPQVRILPGTQVFWLVRGISLRHPGGRSREPTDAINQVNTAAALNALSAKDFGVAQRTMCPDEISRTGHRRLDALLMLVVVVALYGAMAFAVPAIQAVIQAVTKRLASTSPPRHPGQPPSTTSAGR